MAPKTTAWDAAELLETEEMQAAYLDEAFASGDMPYIAHCLGTVARARGMTDIARAAGVSRESLYRALSEHGHPEFDTVMKVVKALGLRLTVAPAAEPA